jgi:predicted lipoprotein with Yx(FWY)xxD motif
MGFWRLTSVAGIPAADRALVHLERSTNGLVLDTPTAFGTTRTLYHLSFDLPNMSTCTGPCTGIWPPLLTNQMPAAGLGVSVTGLGMLRRGDGSMQVTYFGKPLYLFAFDLGAGQPSGQTNGNNFIDPPAFGVWDTISPNGLVNPGAITVQTEASGLLSTPATTSGGTTATVYAYTGDTATMSDCRALCAKFWPPLLTSRPPMAGAGATAGLLGTIMRADGSLQVTYNGHPLYLFSDGLNPSAAGEGVSAFGGRFQTLTAAGVPR